MSNIWTEEDQEKLLDAICTGVSVSHTIEIVLEQTAHTEEEVRIRLESMGVIDQPDDLEY